MIRSILTASIIAIATLAHAEPNRGAVEKRAEELIPFVEIATGYKVTTKPRIVFQSLENLNRIFYQDNYNGQDGVQAITIGNVIMLRSDFEVGENDDVLVHELTHFAQFENGKDGDGCAGRLEPEAYHVSDLWLVARGKPPSSDPMTVLVSVMACSGD